MTLSRILSSVVLFFLFLNVNIIASFLKTSIFIFTELLEMLSVREIRKTKLTTELNSPTAVERELRFLNTLSIYIIGYIIADLR